MAEKLDGRRKVERNRHRGESLKEVTAECSMQKCAECILLNWGCGRVNLEGRVQRRRGKKSGRGEHNADEELHRLKQRAQQSGRTRAQPCPTARLRTANDWQGLHMKRVD